MGAYLSSPVREKEIEEGENRSFKYGICAMQGWRTGMEDAHVAVLDLHPDSSGKSSALFAVLDGHGGAEVARFVANHLAQELVSSEAFRASDLEQALVQSYLRMDELLVKEEHRWELRSLRANISEEEGASGPLVINGASLPESLLEALGMPSDAGFHIKLVRAGPGSQSILIDDIDDAEEAKEGSGHSAATNVELVEQNIVEADKEKEEAEKGATERVDGKEDVRTPAPASDVLERNSKRKRKDNAVDMAVDEDSEAATHPTNININTGDKQLVAAVATLQQHESEKGHGTDAEEATVEVTPEKEDYQGPSAGCTAVCAVVHGGELYVSNAGDSRCVLCRGQTALAMTHDHKPTDAEEYARITRAGGFVAEGRVNGSLNLSRALGDLEYKGSKELGPKEQMVTAMPEVRHVTLQPGDEFLILACDGIWDVLSNQEAVDFVRERLAAGKSPRKICEEMCDHCLAPDTSGCGKGCDNMSVVVVVLKDFVQAG